MRILAESIGEGEALNLSTTPSVVLVIGVNGVGKTTSIAKIANLLKKGGKRVMLAAADTFRAAAIDQLAVWAERVGVELIRGEERTTPHLLYTMRQMQLRAAAPMFSSSIQPGAFTIKRI